MKSFIVLLGLVALTSANFTNHKVYRVKAANVKQLETIHSFETEDGVDFWSKMFVINADIDVMIAPKQQESFKQTLSENGIKFKELISNVETVVQQEKLENMITQRTSRATGGINVDKYNRHETIDNYLQQLALDFPQLVTYSVPGKSYEGRPISMIKLSTGARADGAKKPAILIDAGIHAREWIASATVVYFISELVEKNANRYLIENVDWYIIPMINPDGYERTHSGTNNRFWRKTTTKGQRCDGVDANRNFDFHWMESGASSSECSETYAGPRGFSESESRTLKKVVEEHKDEIKLYLTFHSYGEYLLYPWGFTTSLPKDWKILDTLATHVGNAIEDVRGTRYTIGSSTNVLYAAAGGSDDWVKGVGGVDLAYTIELPGGGRNGFDPPPSDIRRIAEETWEGLKVYHAYVDANLSV